MNFITSLYVIGRFENVPRVKHITFLGIRKFFRIWCSCPYSLRRYGMLSSSLKAPDMTASRKNILFLYQKEFRFLSSSIRRPMAEDTKPDVSTPLTKQQMQDLILHLTAEERNDLQNALHEFEAKKTKSEYEGQLAGVRWRSTFGRPSKLPTLGDVDPTGTYCTVPDDWLIRKYAETVPPPNTNELVQVAIHNAIPFVGFGFLDNFCMILAGDQIEVMVGSIMVLSTMAAAALGNTISDIMGIGSAWYVERLALSIGIKPPKLTPIQLDMPLSRRASNLGRVLGVTVGCLLGMFPLMFIGKKKKKEDIVTTSPEPGDT